MAADIFEQAPELTEIGAAIALSANSTREFARLGLLDQLDAVSTDPDRADLPGLADGDRIAAHPVAKDGWYVKRFGAPYFGIHRADLQKILGGAFGSEHLHLGCRLVNIVEQPDARRRWSSPTAASSKPTSSSAPTACAPPSGAGSPAPTTPSTPGTSAFRGIVPTENLPSLPDPHAIQFWMGPDAHVLHYAIGGDGDAVNFFAVVEAPQIWLHDGSIVEVGRGGAGRLVPRAGIRRSPR